MNNAGDDAALLGLDIGTSSCKLIAYTVDGLVIASASAGYRVYHPRPGWAELSPGDVLNAVETVFGEISDSLRGFDNLHAAISAQGEAFVLADGRGHALSPMPVSLDMRGLENIEALRRDREAQRLIRAAGQLPRPISSLAKLLWFRDQANETLSRAEQLLCVGEFVMRHLGLDPLMDYSMGALTGLLDIHNLSWSSEILEFTGLSPGLLPPVTASGRFVGTVAATKMERFGLNQPVNFYTGGHDQACAMLGAGIAGATMALYSIGTTEAIGMQTKTPDDVGLEELHISPYPHVIDGEYILLFGSQHGGRVLQWLVDLLGRELESMIPGEPPSEPSDLQLIPHLEGSGTVRGDDRARGAIHGLNYDTTGEDLVLAALEGITMEQMVGLERLSSHGLSPSVLRAVGGGSRSDVWMQIKANITGLPIECLEETDTACTGAAALAGFGAGLFDSALSAADRFIRIRRRFEPRTDMHDAYSAKRILFEAAYEAGTQLRRLKADKAKRGMSAETGNGSS